MLRLNQEITRVIAEPEHKGRMAALGVELAGSTPEAFADLIKSESARMGPLLRSAVRVGQGG